MARWSPQDCQFMELALDLAEQGRGFVEPNPMVGCVLAKNGQIVGRGYHRRFGGPHAEVNALRAAGVDGARGTTAYVSLEPCSHVGKTPPCAEALIRARVKRVVVAMKDPNAVVAGRGIRLLRREGIRVEVGLQRGRAMALNAPFITFHEQRRPFVILKWAQSIDGKIATRTGESKWITSRQSRAAGHALRARVDAVIVGVGTVLADDPELTARLVKPRRVAARVVLDTHLRTPLGSKLIRTARQTPTLIVTGTVNVARGSGKSKSRGGIPRKLRRLEAAGCEVLQIPSHKTGVRIGALLRRLHARGMTNVLVEGGGGVLGAFMQDGLADEARIFVAPILIGGETSPGPLRQVGPATMRDIPGVLVREVVRFGPDTCYSVCFG